MKIFIAIGAIVICAATSLAIHQRTESQLRGLDKQIADQSQELTRAAAENNQLSNIFGASPDNRPLTGEKLAELLKLRNEVAQLRRSNAEIARLQSRNQKLRAALDKKNDQLAIAKSLPNYWPKDQLSHSGFAEPSSST